MVRGKTHAEFITGLDIGSTMIRVVVGQFLYSNDAENKLKIIGAVEVPSEGVQKGVITNLEETVSALSHALEAAERVVGVPIEHVWVGVSGSQIICQDSKGVVAVARTDGEITDEDVARAVEAGKTIAPPLNYEILHVLPRGFAVDGQTGVKDPVGMTGIRLEVDTKIIYGVSSHIKNLTKAVYRTGVDIDDFVLSILAAGNVVLSSRQKDLGAVVINLGGPTTSLVVYEEGEIIHTAILPVSSSHITNDLALGLKTSIDIAERVKKEYGECESRGVPKKDMVDLSLLGTRDSEMVSRFYIAQIIEARVREILEKVGDELKKIRRAGILPAGAYFIGGGAHLGGLLPLAKEELRLPSALGYPLGVESISDKVNDIGFAPAIGLVKWGAEMAAIGGSRASKSRALGGKLVNTLQKIFRSLVP